MSYIDVLKQTQNVMTPGSSACQGCGGELILRRVMQIAGSNSVFAVPPGCMAGAGVDGWNFSNGCTAPIHITLLDNTAAFMSGVSEMYQRRGRTDVNIVAIADRRQQLLTAASRAFPALPSAVQKCSMSATTMRDT